MNTLKFAKMHGAGNNFVIFEDMDNKYKNLEGIAKVLCDRAFGIGADGILLVRKSSTAEIQMVIINADGSYAAMCGNGLRCFVKYVYEKGIVKSEIMKVETGDGIKIATVKLQEGMVREVKINMGIPSFDPGHIPASSEDIIINRPIEVNGKAYKLNTLLLGVPHTIIIDKLDNFKVEEGKAIEKFELFPQGTNVNFTEVISRKEIKVKTWERGAGATLACGTGSCAAVVACNKLGLVDKEVKVNIPGGVLFIEITEEGIMMTGPAVTVYEGETVELEVK